MIFFLFFLVFLVDMSLNQWPTPFCSPLSGQKKKKLTFFSFFYKYFITTYTQTWAENTEKIFNRKDFSEDAVYFLHFVRNKSTLFRGMGSTPPPEGTCPPLMIESKFIFLQYKYLDEINIHFTSHIHSFKLSNDYRNFAKSSSKFSIKIGEIVKGETKCKM